MISKILQILGFQPRISKVFLDHYNNFFSQQGRTILVTKYHLYHVSLISSSVAILIFCLTNIFRLTDFVLRFAALFSRIFMSGCHLSNFCESNEFLAPTFEIPAALPLPPVAAGLFFSELAGFSCPMATERVSKRPISLSIFSLAALKPKKNIVSCKVHIF